MKLSTKSRYCVRLLVDLAKYGTQKPVSMGEISKRQEISVKYLEQLIRPLKQAKLILSVRGPKGGHQLTKKPEEITIGEIVRLFEIPNGRVKGGTKPEKCFISDDCQVKLAWKSATQVLYDKLDSMTIDDLAKGKFSEI